MSTRVGNCHIFGNAVVFNGCCRSLAADDDNGKNGIVSGVGYQRQVG